MSRGRAHLPLLLASLLFSCACAYIVLPADSDAPVSSEARGWTAVVTSVGRSETGDLHIDLAIRNTTGDWSAMTAAEGKPAILRSSGQEIKCETVQVSSGGHRLAPGFQMRGYTGGTKSEPKIQLLYVECGTAEATAGSVLAVDYSYVTGQYNYYEQDKGKLEAVLELKLDEAVQTLTYPVAEAVEGLIQPASTEMIAINKVALGLADIQRTGEGFQFTWQASNPGEYPSYVHIGDPPVIGQDGILYGYYQTPDIVSVPIVPAGDKAEWTTEVAVPVEIGNCYILLSVESGKARLFANYAIEIVDQ